MAASDEEKAALAEKLAGIAAALAAEKAAIASKAADEKAAIQAGLAAQQGAIASRLQQEKAVQQAILASQKSASEASANYDKYQHEQKLAAIKSEGAAQHAERKRDEAEFDAWSKRVSREHGKSKGGGGEGLAEKGVGASFLEGLMPGAEKLGTSAGLASAAGGVVAMGAEKLLGAAIELGKAGASLVEAGVKLSIAETSKKEVQSAVFKKLGGNFEATVDLALKLGIPVDEAVEQSKKLLNAKFSQSEIPVLLKIKAGMDLAGLDGDALLKKLETIKLEPKVKTKDIDGLAKLGIDSKEVYKELAKTLHTDVAGAMAKVKAGAVDAATATAAIEKVATGKFGPLADVLGNSIPVLLMRLKGQFAKLFDSVDLGPMKEALKNANAALEGPEGKAMKGAATEAGNAVFEALFGPLKGSEGRNRMTQFAAMFIQSMHAIRDAAKVAGAAIKELVAAAASGKKSTIGEAVKGNEAKGKAAAGGVDFGGSIGDILGKEAAKAKIGEALGSSLDLSAVNDSMAEKGGAIGKGVTDGVVEGVNGGSPDAVGAAVAMAEKMLAAIKARLGQHSPSTEFAEVGHFSAEGLAKGMAANDNATAAAGDMGKRALGAAKDAGGPGGAPEGGGSKAASAGGGISITINIGAGVSPAAAAAVKAALAEEIPKLEAMLRRIQRDQAEGKAA